MTDMSQQDLPDKSGRVINKSELRIETRFPQISCNFSLIPSKQHSPAAVRSEAQCAKATCIRQPVQGQKKRKLRQRELCTSKLHLNPQRSPSCGQKLTATRRPPVLYTWKGNWNVSMAMDTVTSSGFIAPRETVHQSTSAPLSSHTLHDEMRRLRARHLELFTCLRRWRQSSFERRESSSNNA